MNERMKGPRTANVVHATSLLIAREVDDERREITGMATTARVDSYNDIVEPLGVRFELPLPLLLHHDHREPVGSVTFAQATKEGIRFKATIAKIGEPGTLQERCNVAWQSIKNSLIRAVSIGFSPLAVEPREGGNGKRYTAWTWRELSLVTLPANQAATIDAWRSPAELMVERQLAADRAARMRATVKASNAYYNSPEFQAKLADYRRRYPSRNTGACGVVRLDKPET